MHCDPLRLKSGSSDRGRASQSEPFNAHFYAPFTAMTITHMQCSHFRSANPSQLVPRTSRRIALLRGHGTAYPNRENWSREWTRAHSFRHHAAIKSLWSEDHHRSPMFTNVLERDASRSSRGYVTTPSIVLRSRSRSRDPHFNESIGALSWHTVASPKCVRDRRVVVVYAYKNIRFISDKIEIVVQSDS